ncbi:hypothetical protein EJ110_NYTH57461 [Nymphaea thermarum]|nr:hypothetical protein EJ110_NYTH57461 [Nymphaea thermarum]
MGRILPSWSGGILALPLSEAVHSWLSLDPFGILVQHLEWLQWLWCFPGQWSRVLTVMRRYNIPEPYEKLKEMTRGRTVTQESMQEFVQGLELPDEPKSILLNLSPVSYIGAAEELAKSVRRVRTAMD